MNDYEMVYIVNPRLTSEEAERATAWVDGLIRDGGGELLATDVWGRRRLAYPIKHQFEGTYVYSTFRLDPTATRRVESELTLSEDVLRHLMIRGIVEGGKPEPQSARVMAGGRPYAAPRPQSDAPEAPEASDAPEAPEASDAPEAPEASDAPEAPEASDAPEAPEASDAPEAPEASDAPEAPEASDAPEAPEASDAPEAPEASDAPEAPEASDAPEAPEASDAPEAPEASDALAPEAEAVPDADPPGPSDLGETDAADSEPEAKPEPAGVE